MADLETLRKHLGQNLRRARAQAGLSQREVAQHPGVSRPTYTYYETGHTAPSVFDLYRLAQLYGCPMEDFLR
ncbi:MAG TPA: helix-turn-helix domain-containing protein [Candidatus Acutalibacter stercorigallinarum]|nr:helix-turn-helix domain-containing protein [Candidatus Acutalibacter stercorigallinarum]